MITITDDVYLVIFSNGTFKILSQQAGDNINVITLIGFTVHGQSYCTYFPFETIPLQSSCSQYCEINVITSLIILKPDKEELWRQNMCDVINRQPIFDLYWVFFRKFSGVSRSLAKVGLAMPS